MRKVIVADDEAHIRHVLGMKLESAGFEVRTASNGAEALELIEAQAPDLLLTDYEMPRMTGLELAQALRGREDTAELPVVMLSARGFTLTDDDLATTNIVQVYPKPFSPRDVLGRVTQLLSEMDRQEAK